MTGSGHRQQRGVARRNAILGAAVELLLDQGMAAITHRAVADAAHVPLGAIRYYFQTREALLLACVESVEWERRDAAADIVLATSRWAHPPPMEMTVELLVRCYMGPRLDDCALRATIGWVVDSAREGPALAELLADQRQVIDEQLSAILIASGFPTAPVDLVCAVMDGTLVSATAERTNGVVERVVKAVVQLLRMLQPPVQ